MKLRNKKTGEIGELNYYDGLAIRNDKTGAVVFAKMPKEKE